MFLVLKEKESRLIVLGRKRFLDESCDVQEYWWDICAAADCFLGPD
jgi:hypothetical protein